MKKLPQTYMMLSAEVRAKKFAETLSALENVSGTSLQQILRQLNDMEAKRNLMKEIIINEYEGYDLYTTLVQIENTLSIDSEYAQE